MVALGGTSSPAFVIPVGFVSVHGGVNGTPWLQLQDDTGYPNWGVGGGIAADWVDTPATHIPLVTADGHVLSLWQSSDASPPSEVRAVELDESGALAPGWPSPWAVVCGDVSGRSFADAIVSGQHVFVAWASDEGSGVLPLVQRLSPAVLGVEEAWPSRPLELSPPSPNPARGAWSMRVSVRDPVPVTLDAFDVAGRRVLERDLGLLSPGAHAVRVDPGASLAPGVYRVCVRAGVHSAERIVVRIRRTQGDPALLNSKVPMYRVR